VQEGWALKGCKDVWSVLYGLAILGKLGVCIMSVFSSSRLRSLE
jgi:hypothetical protein